MPQNWWEAAPVVKGEDQWWLAAPEVEPPNVPALAGRTTELRQGEPQSGWSKAWDTFRHALFGAEDREEAKAAGVALQPTTAEMMETGLAGAAFAGAPPAARAVGGAVVRGVKGPLGAVGRWIADHPRAVGMAAGAAPGAITGDVKDAMIGAAFGLTGGTALSADDAVKAAKGLLKAGKHEEARAVVDAARKAASGASKTGPKAVPKPPAKAAPPQKKPDLGKAAATAHAAKVQFAKQIAQGNPKVGEKIWILLDDAGNPIKHLTSDQAGAAARKGLPTTWVRNLWTATPRGRGATK